MIHGNKTFVFVDVLTHCSCYYNVNYRSMPALKRPSNMMKLS